MMLNTAREILRDRMFTVILIFGVVIIFSSKLIAPLSLDEDLRIVRDIGLSTISIFGLLVTLIIGTRLIYDEIQRKTVYTILPKPVRRWEFILGKYLGISLALVCVVAILTIGFIGYQLLFKFPLTLNLLTAVILTIGELFLTAAVAITFSTFTTPIGSGLFTLTIYFVGHFTRDLLALGDMSKSAVLKLFTTLFYYTLPNLSYFNAKSEFVHNLTIPREWLFFSLGYCLAYIAILLSLAVVIFERKDL